MKVLHINGNYIWTTLHQLMVRVLGSVGIENFVFVPSYNKKNAVIEVDDNVVVEECFKKRDRFLYYYKQKKIISAVEKSYNVELFDLIHAYTLFTDGNIAMQLSKRYGIPYVVAVRNTDINYFFKYRVFLRNKGIEILKNAFAVFFLSDTYKEKTISFYIPDRLTNVIREKSYVVPNGIDNFWLENKYIDRDYNKIEKKLSQKELKIIFAGSIDRNKNIELTVSASEELIKNGWRVSFMVVGRIVDEKIARRLRKKSFVSVIDEMPKESLINLYREADVFVMPSHYESFGLVYAEAMSQGLPVIYTRGQGFDKQFVDGFVGYSVDDKDEKDIVNKIGKVTEEYSTISKRCLEEVNRFDWKVVAQQYLYVYNNIVE